MKSLEIIKNKKRKDISEIDIIDTWLIEYHNTTFKDYIKWFDKKYPGYLDENGNISVDQKIKFANDHKVILSSIFYDKYPVTEEQYDIWKKEIKIVLKKKFRYNNALFDRSWAFLSLNVAPKLIYQNI